MPRTQKANGLEVLKNMGVPINFSVVDPKTYVPRINGNPYFARPCPTRPRHGFVDSRVVHNNDELKSLITETLKEDEDGEIVLMRPIEAQYSGVMTPGLCAIGPGNDGITSGKGTSIKFPIGDMLQLQAAGLAAGIKGAPYIEFVNHHVVQLRDGPPVPTMLAGEKRWIPRKEEIRKLHRPIETNLLEWEKLIENLGPGEAVWLPGHTMLSHFAVHAVCAKKAIFFDQDKPSLPIQVEPSKKLPQANIKHRQAFRAGIQHGSTICLDDHEVRQSAGYTAVFSAHHGPALLEDPEGCFVLGMGVALLLRLSFSASLGERRHSEGVHLGRAIIYDSMLQKNWQSQIGLVEEAAVNFREKRWRNGYGGPAWAHCTETSIALAKTISDGRPIREVLRALNNAIHAAHNNGKWLNKFISTGVFNALAIGSIDMTVHSVGAVWKVADMKPMSNKLPDLEFQTYPEFYASKVGSKIEGCNCSACKPKVVVGSPLLPEDPNQNEDPDEEEDKYIPQGPLNPCGDPECSQCHKGPDNPCVNEDCVRCHPAEEEEDEDEPDEDIPQAVEEDEDDPSSDEDDGEEDDNEPNETEKLKMIQPMSNKVVQWRVRGGTELHFQMGKPDNYSKISISAGPEADLAHTETKPSLAGSSTLYAAATVPSLTDQVTTMYAQLEAKANEIETRKKDVGRLLEWLRDHG